jgi:tRNA (guanine-N7-)-methyltransferase
MRSQFPDLLYGRRKGKPIKATQQRLMDRDLPILSVKLPPVKLETLKGVFADQDYSEYWFEIGFGGGEHIAAQAQKHPNVGMIGAEAFVNGVASLVQLIDQHQLTNVHIYSGDGRQLLKVLPDASLTKVIILFPDPWPKLRHHKRRLVNEQILKEVSRVLKPGGELRIGSDHVNYIQWSLEKVGKMAQFVPQFDPANVPEMRPSGWEPTRYESKALASGSPCYYLTYSLRLSSFGCVAHRDSPSVTY